VASIAQALDEARVSASCRRSRSIRSSRARCGAAWTTGPPSRSTGLRRLAQRGRESRCQGALPGFMGIQARSPACASHRARRHRGRYLSRAPTARPAGRGAERTTHRHDSCRRDRGSACGTGSRRRSKFSVALRSTADGDAGDETTHSGDVLAVAAMCSGCGGGAAEQFVSSANAACREREHRRRARHLGRRRLRRTRGSSRRSAG
jgi:hypothetical protein